MEAYDRVAKVVEPKRQKLTQSESQLDVVMQALRGKQMELQVGFHALACTALVVLPVGHAGPAG